jgi:hypothetical protein
MGNKPTNVFNRQKIFEMPWKIHFETGPVDVVDIWAILYLTSYLTGEGASRLFLNISNTLSTFRQKRPLFRENKGVNASFLWITGKLPRLRIGSYIHLGIFPTYCILHIYVRLLSSFAETS